MRRLLTLVMMLSCIAVIQKMGHRHTHMLKNQIIRLSYTRY